MRSPADRLKDARRKAGYTSAKDAAARVGVPYFSYVQHESGTRNMTTERAEQYARAFGVTMDWLLTGRGNGGGSPRTVPLVGYVGAGAEAHFYGAGDGNLDYVDAPPGSTTDTVAAEIRGPSLGPLFDRWLVFYDDVRAPVTPDLFGRLCIVGLPDERVLVKQIKPAGLPHHFHLLSNNEEPMFDQEVNWAARVTAMTPR